MQNGKMLFFVETPCGNAGKATPVIPPTPPVTHPTASLVCTALKLLGGATDTKGDVTYTLQATAAGTNAVPASYTFNFGQGQGTQVVNSTSTTVSSNPHTYAPGTYSVNVTVTGTPTNGATVAPNPVSCPASFTVNQPPTGTLECTAFALNQKATDATSNNTTATLTATVTPSSPTAFTSYTYQFNFGKSGSGTDQGTQTVQTTSTTATSNVHTYVPGTYTKISVTITGKTPAGKIVSATRTCQTNLTIPSPTCAQNSNQSECVKPTCTAPNGQTYPVGSSECTTTPVVLTSVVTPPKLTNTGPGETIGLFAAVTIGGAFLHSYLTRRFAKARG